MSRIFPQRLSLVISLATLAVLGRGLLAQAETLKPGSTETSAKPLVPAQQIGISSPAATTSFSDLGADYWAYPFIQALAAKNIIAGFPDGTFKPEQPITRAEFAAMLQKAVSHHLVQQLSPGGFTDVPTNYWAASAIKFASATGFMSGYPDHSFHPYEEILKVQAIVSLVSGLGLTPQGSTTDVVKTYYTDAMQIPTYAVNDVAAATQAHLIINYPDVHVFNPQVALTRAQAAAHLYQALVKLGQVQPLVNNAAASYIVGGTGTGQNTPTTPSAQAPTGTARRTRVRDYIGIGGNIGLSGNRTSLGGGGFAILGRTGLFKLGNSINLSLHNANVVFGNRTATSMFALTLEDPIRNKTSERVVVSPFFGGGLLFRKPDSSTKVAPLLAGGIDIPLSRSLTATAQVNVGFLREDTEVGLLLGIGYNFNLFRTLFGHKR